VVCVSVCLLITLSPAKWLNRSRWRLKVRLKWAQETICYSLGREPPGNWQFWSCPHNERHWESLLRRFEDVFSWLVRRKSWKFAIFLLPVYVALKAVTRLSLPALSISTKFEVDTTSNRISNRIGRPIQFRIEFSNRIGRIYHASRNTVTAVTLLPWSRYVVYS